MHESLDRLAATQSELADYTGRVMLLDEALTVSARIAAKTGNPIDAQRYDKLATELGTLIKETKEALSEPAILRSVDQTEQANRHLVEIERRGIAIASDGRLTEATAQLDNDEYLKWKAVFAGGVEKTVAQQREAIAGAEQQVRLLTFASSASSGVIILVILATWYLAFRTWRQWNQTTKALAREIEERERVQEQLAVASIIVENSPTIVYRVAGQPTMPVTFISSNIAKLGYDPADFLASPVFYRSLIHPDDRTIVEESQQRRSEGGGSETIQFRLRAKDGSYHWVENFASPTRDEAGHLLYAEGTLNDITERKLAEEKIREDEATIHALVEQSVTGIYIIDEDGRIAYVNPQFAKTVGYESAEDFVGRPLIDFIADADKSSIREAMSDLLTGRLSTVVSAAGVLSKQGNVVEALAQASLTTFHGKCAIVGVVMDITERKRAERELQFANTLQSTAMETSPDAILIVDEHARIISYNLHFARMWKIPEVALRAGDDAPVLAAVTASMKDSAAFVARVRHLYAHPEEIAHEELETNDGRFIERHTAPLRAGAGEYLGRVWFFRDITERKLTTAELHRTAQTGFIDRARQPSRVHEGGRAGNRAGGERRQELRGSLSRSRPFQGRE